MKSEKFGELLHLIITTYDPKMSDQARLEITAQLQQFIKDESVGIDRNIARYIIKKIKGLLDKPSYTPECKEFWEGYKQEIRTDAMQPILDLVGEVFATIEPDLEATLLEEDGTEQLNLMSKNAIMVDNYKNGYKTILTAINAIVIFIKSAANDPQYKPRLNKLIKTLTGPLNCLLKTAFDIELAIMLQYTALDKKIDDFHEGALKEYFDVPDGKALHIVNVFDGSGDFVLMEKWISTYEKIRPGKSEVLIIYDERHHNLDEIYDMIDSLPDSHVIKKLDPYNIEVINANTVNIWLKRRLFADNQFSALPPKSSYNAMYAVSFIGKRLLAQVRNYSTIGMKCCMISEMGVNFSTTLNCTALTFGTANPEQGYCGAFFEDYGDIIPLEQLVSSLSTTMQKIIFSADYQNLTTKDKISQLQDLTLIAGYYQAQRNTFSLEVLINEKLSQNGKVKLVLTGHNEIPAEILALSSRINNPNFSICCAKFDKEDYIALLQLLRTSHQHIYFASGDNTIQLSLSLGKPIFYLNRAADHEDSIRIEKSNYIKDFIELMLSIYSQLGAKNKNIEANYLREIITLTLSSQHENTEGLTVKSMIPSKEAMLYFANTIVPYLKNNFDIEKNMPQIIEAVEQGKSLALSPEPFEEKIKKASPKRRM